MTNPLNQMTIFEVIAHFHEAKNQILSKMKKAVEEIKDNLQTQIEFVKDLQSVNPQIQSMIDLRILSFATQLEVLLGMKILILKIRRVPHHRMDLQAKGGISQNILKWSFDLIKITMIILFIPLSFQIQGELLNLSQSRFRLLPVRNLINSNSPQ